MPVELADAELAMAVGTGTVLAVNALVIAEMLSLSSCKLITVNDMLAVRTRSQSFLTWFFFGGARNWKSIDCVFAFAVRLFSHSASGCVTTSFVAPRL